MNTENINPAPEKSFTSEQQISPSKKTKPWEEQRDKWEKAGLALQPLFSFTKVFCQITCWVLQFTLNMNSFPVDTVARQSLLSLQNHLYSKQR